MSKQNYIPWVEKYRPKRLDDVVQQDEVIKVLKKTIETGEMPHLLLHGQAGTGKTSTVLALAMQLYGPNIIDDRVIELNASDERGINVVRDKIINFSKMSVGTKDSKYPCPDFKIVILDEADALTTEAQSSLRKVMEDMSKVTRFCFICNYVNKIIEPINSRCMKFRFKPLENDAIRERLKLIMNKENMNISEDCLEKIIEISNGDARKAIMTLQNMKYIIPLKKKLIPDDIVILTGGIENNKFLDFWKICKTGDIKSVRELALQIYRDGYSSKNILEHLVTFVINDNISDEKKSLISHKIAGTDMCLLDGASEYIQILNILVYVNLIIKN